MSTDGPARSGEKYITAQGFSAIRDGIKATSQGSVRVPGGKPRWLKAPLAIGPGYEAVRRTVREHRLATVCEEAKCPNIGECWNAGTATIMLMGEVCTRACRFCAVDTGNPRGWLDPEEPENTAKTVELMRLRYVVLTSVNRDDLRDGGAGHFAAAVRAIKARSPSTAVEALTPDFQGVMHDVETVVELVPVYVREGLYISFSGGVTWTNARRVPAACQATPATHLLIETDAPYQPPHPLDARPCRPASIVRVAEVVAALRDTSPDHIAQLTWDNAHRALALPQ